MIISRRRKRARKSPTFFQPEILVSSDQVTNGKKGTVNLSQKKKKCEGTSTTVRNKPLKFKDRFERPQGKVSRKRQDLDSISTPINNGKKKKPSNEKKDGATTKEDYRPCLTPKHKRNAVGGSTKATDDFRAIVEKQFPRRKGQSNQSCKSQMVGEDIRCDVGLAFIHMESDSEGESERDPVWLDRHADRPNLTRWDPHVKRPIRKGVGTSTSNQLAGGMKKLNQILYKSRITHEGASINLGSHLSATAAAAAQDLANLSLLGSDDGKPMQILSRDEAVAALRAVEIPGCSYNGQVDAICFQFTEQKKVLFERSIDQALASIGGQDDVLADILSSVDAETFAAAQAGDAVIAAERLVVLKKEKRARARLEKKQLFLQNLKGSDSDASSSNESTMEEFAADVDDFLFCSGHGLYGVDSHGQLLWKRETASDSRDTKKDERTETCAVTKTKIDTRIASLEQWINEAKPVPTTLQISGPVNPSVREKNKDSPKPSHPSSDSLGPATEGDSNFLELSLLRETATVESRLETVKNAVTFSQLGKEVSKCGATGAPVAKPTLNANKMVKSPQICSNSVLDEHVANADTQTDSKKDSPKHKKSVLNGKETKHEYLRGEVKTDLAHQKYQEVKNVCSNTEAKCNGKQEIQDEKLLHRKRRPAPQALSSCSKNSMNHKSAFPGAVVRNDYRRLKDACKKNGMATENHLTTGKLQHGLHLSVPDIHDELSSDLVTCGGIDGNDEIGCLIGLGLRQIPRQNQGVTEQPVPTILGQSRIPTISLKCLNGNELDTCDEGHSQIMPDPLLQKSHNHELPSMEYNESFLSPPFPSSGCNSLTSRPTHISVVSQISIRPYAPLDKSRTPRNLGASCLMDYSTTETVPNSTSNFFMHGIQHKSKFGFHHQNCSKPPTAEQFRPFPYNSFSGREMNMLKQAYNQSQGPSHRHQDILCSMGAMESLQVVSSVKMAPVQFSDTSGYLHDGCNLQRQPEGRAKGIFETLEQRMERESVISRTQTFNPSLGNEASSGVLASPIFVSNNKTVENKISTRSAKITETKEEESTTSQSFPVHAKEKQLINGGNVFQDFIGANIMTRRKLKARSSEEYVEPIRKKRRKKCGKCTNCTKDDCGKCANCHDMLKFGGQNRKRQKCIQRKCPMLGKV